MTYEAEKDIKHPRHEEALSGVKASNARLLSEAEAHRKEKPQELATKKMQAVTEEIREPEPASAADEFKIDYGSSIQGSIQNSRKQYAVKNFSCGTSGHQEPK